jgi:uncharacterized membrane protein
MLGFTRSILFRALALGIAAGMRSQSPGAVLAYRQPVAPRRAGWRSWPVLRSAWGRRALMLSGAGELASDKLPDIPPRTSPGSLTGRLLFGTLAGLAIGTEGRGKATLAKAAVAGLLGAAIGAFGGQRARQAVVNMTGLPDPAVAVVEDLAAVSLANSAIQRRA